MVFRTEDFSFFYFLFLRTLKMPKKAMVFGAEDVTKIQGG